MNTIFFHEARMCSQTYYKCNIDRYNFKHSVWKFQSIKLVEQRNGEKEGVDHSFYKKILHLKWFIIRYLYRAPSNNNNNNK